MRLSSLTTAGSAGANSIPSFSTWIRCNEPAKATTPLTLSLNEVKREGEGGDNNNNFGQQLAVHGRGYHLSTAVDSEVPSGTTKPTKGAT